MRRWRRREVNGVSTVLGKGCAYVLFGVTYVIGFLVDRLVRGFRSNEAYVIDDGAVVTFKDVANKVYDVSYVIFEFVWRCILWIIVNIVGAFIIGILLYIVGFFAIIFAAMFGGDRHTVIEEYYYYS